MGNSEVLLVCIISFLIGIIIGLIKGFEWCFPVTLISMMIIGLIWLWKDNKKLKKQMLVRK